MNRQDKAVTLPVMGSGTEFLLRMVDALPDDALAGPSPLPGWTRAHVIGHVARNAEALVRLATWARTGVETPMYADPQQRGADIESSSRHPVAVLRAELVDTAEALDSALAALDDHTWTAEIRSAQGRAIPAAELPWMRCREVWLHAVDLDAGATTDELPAEMIDGLLDDVTGWMSGRDDCPPATLAPTDRNHTWHLGGGGHDVRASAAELVAWLTGRTPPQENLPLLPRWL